MVTVFGLTASDQVIFAIAGMNGGANTGKLPLAIVGTFFSAPVFTGVLWGGVGLGTCGLFFSSSFPTGNGFDFSF